MGAWVMAAAAMVVASLRSSAVGFRQQEGGGGDDVELAGVVSLAWRRYRCRVSRRGPSTRSRWRCLRRGEPNRYTSLLVASPLAPKTSAVHRIAGAVAGELVDEGGEDGAVLERAVTSPLRHKREYTPWKREEVLF